MHSITYHVCECCQAWVGHPYFDVIDNSTDFDRKVMRMVAVRIYAVTFDEVSL